MNCLSKTVWCGYRKDGRERSVRTILVHEVHQKLEKASPQILSETPGTAPEYLPEADIDKPHHSLIGMTPDVIRIVCNVSLW